MALGLSLNGWAQSPGHPAANPVFITDPAKIAGKDKFDIQPFTIDKLYMTRAVGDSAWSPDGRQVAFVSNISGRENLWLAPSEGGWPEQLTVSGQRQATPAWQPTGRWIAYASDYDGDEQWDLFLVSPRNGEVLNITNTPAISEKDPAWSPDGAFLAYLVKPRESSTYEIDIMEVVTKKVRHLTANTPANLSNSNPLWSKDGKWVVFSRERSDGADSNIMMASADDGKIVNLTPHHAEIGGPGQIFFASHISPDGKTLLITSDARNGYSNAGLLDIATQKIDWLTTGQWETTSGRFFPYGKRLTWTTNIDGNTSIFVFDLHTRQSHALPLGAGINHLAGAETPFTRDGSRMIYYHNGSTAPQDLWTYNFATGQTRQITHALVAGVRGEDMVEPFLVHYPSGDGRWQISAWVYVPYNAERNGKNAAIVYIHGGPASQAVNGFNRNIQYLVNQGYFVIAPNYRGSTGYGREFMEANRFDMGGGDLQDVIAAAAWMGRTGYIDPAKVAVMGASYGGYLTMMAVAKAPDMWAAGVPIVPFVNWFTEMENEDPLLREYDRATMGDSLKDKDRFRDRSPIYFVDQVKAPLMILAGGHDPRCPSTEAEQVASAIQKRKGVAELKIYENEGHGFAKVENQIDAYTRVADFLKKYAAPAKCGCNIYN